MGDANKLLLELQGKPMIRHVVEAVVGSTASECIVVVGHEAEQVEAVLDGLPVTFRQNPKYPDGMSTSIHAGVTEASEHASGYMICLSDMPFIQSDEYATLITAFDEAFHQDPSAIIVPSYEGQRGNPVVISASFKEAILANQGAVGCRSIVKQHPDHVTWYGMPADHVTRDIDTPTAYQAISGSDPK